MAVRSKPAGIRGGLGEWVRPEDVVQLQAEVAAILTAGDAVRWDPTLKVSYRARIDDELERVVLDSDRAEILAEAVLKLAHKRRHDAIAAHAREHMLNRPAALGIDGSGRSLARCPACDAPINLGHQFGFYCADHQAECAADVAAILAGATP